MDALNWRKASYSASNGGGCVEVGTADRVLVRDTQDRTGPALQFSPAAWRKFADQVKRSLASDIRRVGHMLAGMLPRVAGESRCCRRTAPAGARPVCCGS
jgi:hypothetical protein